ncbi:MAG TPA: D-alanine--D-alanine ligase [Methylomirabilota bacterium]|nr:D-alanine--D-alanine ligase [Methylomirabilota bacterium]
MRQLGWSPVVVDFEGNPGWWLDRLIHGGFGLVFNLCEGLGDQGSEEHLAAAALELLGIPMTGARALTLALCQRKDRANAWLAARGVAVPEWTVAQAAKAVRWRRFPAIVKPVAEDASMGVDAGSVVHTSGDLAAALARGFAGWNHLLVQRYVMGREFNLAVVGDRVLPHAEIDFGELPAGLPRVVTYAAKWEPGSAYHAGTVPRVLDADGSSLVRRLDRLARRVWAAVGGSGYGRIDVRMDERGRLFVLDVNPNPDLSADAGLARQAAAAGWSYADLIAHIVEAAFVQQSAPARQRGRYLVPDALHAVGRVADA